MSNPTIPTHELGSDIGGLIAIAVVIVLVVARRRLGELNAASWLVIWGAVIVLGEHAQFAISYYVPLPIIADGLTGNPMPLLAHARIHFFMAGIYAIIGLISLSVIARTLLNEGRPSGWYTVLFALLAGAGFDLIFGGLWFQHGSPIYLAFRESVGGFGWEFLYGYIVSWTAALAISFKRIFRKGHS